MLSSDAVKNEEKALSTERKISRRNWLTNVAIFTATAGASSLLPCSSPAAGKISKSAAQYQDYPRPMQMCGMCKYFISANGRRGGMMGGGMMGGGMGPGMMAAGTCEVVEGRISPMGWCILYAPSGT
jgi:hypothetical protein